MTSQNVFIQFNFENAWNFCKIYHIYCNFSLKIVENICIDNVSPDRHNFLFIVNIFSQQFSLQITKTLSIEFVELLHYLMYKTNRFRFSARVYRIIDHRRRHSVERTKSYGTRLRFVLSTL